MSKALVVYLMAGRELPELAEAAVEAGADLLELGFPFSDPLADGPVIRRAGERALAQGMRTGACLEVLAETRARLPETPIVPMTYASLLEAYGWERFPADARAAGATSLIVVDLPAGERPELRRVQLVAPTSTDERVRLAAEQTDGWLYLVTVAGTTGPRETVSPALARPRRARPAGDAPAALRGLRHLHPGAGTRGRGARRRDRSRHRSTRRGRERPGRAGQLRRNAPRRARRDSGPGLTSKRKRPHFPNIASSDLLRRDTRPTRLPLAPSTGRE